MKDTIFISGIHGVGKSYLSQQLRNIYPELLHLTASQILKEKLPKTQVDTNKKVKNIDSNQQILIDSFTTIRKRKSGLILFDGHLVLINKQGRLEKIDLDVFRALNLSALILLIGDVNNIYFRLQKRDNLKLDKGLLIKMQEEEIEYSSYISQELNIPLTIIDVDNSQEAIRKLSREVLRYI